MPSGIDRRVEESRERRFACFSRCLIAARSRLSRWYCQKRRRRRAKKSTIKGRAFGKAARARFEEEMKAHRVHVVPGTEHWMLWKDAEVGASPNWAKREMSRDDRR